MFSLKPHFVNLCMMPACVCSSSSEAWQKHCHKLIRQNSYQIKCVFNWAKYITGSTWKSLRSIRENKSKTKFMSICNCHQNEVYFVLFESSCCEHSLGIWVPRYPIQESNMENLIYEEATSWVPHDMKLMDAPRSQRWHRGQTETQRSGSMGSKWHVSKWTNSSW